jgi:hypothetical protein
VASTTSVECFAALRRYDSEPVIPYWKRELTPRVRTRGSQLAKANENRVHGGDNSAGASGEIELDNGGVDAGILDGPERARLSESVGVVV